MQISAFDYIRDRETSAGSLARLGTLIDDARRTAEAAGAPCLLLDNGDTFQGTPVADYLAAHSGETDHPMAAAMNHLGYSAVGLGNHDFDFGIDHLSNNLSQLNMPVVCSNLSSAVLPMVRRSLLIDQQINSSTGQTDVLKIGILSTLPDKTAMWSRGGLEDRAEFVDPVLAVQEQSASLRADGADLVVVLAHMGLATFDEGDEAQNRVQEIAALENVDVIIGGHTHLRFPGADHAGLTDVDWRSGKVHGKPVVQPGPSGTDLAVINLHLGKGGSDAPWQLVSSDVALEATTGETCEKGDLLSLTAPALARTRHYLDDEVARIDHPVHSFFALAAPSAVPAMLAEAKCRVIRAALAETDHADTPLVTSASTALTGGMDGPDNFMFIDKGGVKRRHVAGMNPFANSIWAVKAKGAQLVDWLERAALIFNHLEADKPDQMLIDTQVPGFRYDALYGLEYAIDPSCPPGFDVAGRPVTSSPGRIRDVRWRNKPIDPDQTFIVATTDHRASGGGHYPPFSNEDVIVKGQMQLQDAVLSYLKAPDCDVLHSAKPWRFAPGIQRQAILHSAPQSAKYLSEISHLKPEICGETDQGFLRIRLNL